MPTSPSQPMPSGFAAQLLGAAIAITALLSGCAVKPQMGDSPAATAPVLIDSGARDKAGQTLYSWDTPGAFGKVPAHQQTRGDVACMRARIDLEAIGYHPRAKGFDGQEMADGGFYCYPKANQDRPDAQPPRLTRVNGVTGWDRPVAFGRVPEPLLAKGRQICGDIDPTLEPIGYHPQAQNEQGTPLVGGGYFCAPRVTP